MEDIEVARILIPMVVMAGILLTGCEGPTGPQGEQGEQGLQGEPGTSGIPGVTIVEIQIDPADFFYGQGFADASYPVPEIDQAVMDEGFVIGYYERAPLPLEIYDQGRIVRLSFVVQGNSIRVTMTDSTGEDPRSYFSGSIRFVVVDPTVEVAGKRTAF